MELKWIGADFSVCSVKDASGIDLNSPYCFVGRTDEELSLVCETDRVPASVLAREDGWNAFRIEGVLDFSLVGILAGITEVLARKAIGIFAVSTFNTDYILVRKDSRQKAHEALEAAGYRFV